MPTKISFMILNSPLALGNRGAFVEYSTIGIMQTYPQLFGFDTNAYEYFVEQYNLCGYNLTLSYPSPSPYPTLRASAFLSTDTNDDDTSVDGAEGPDTQDKRRTRRMKRMLNFLDHLPESGSAKVGGSRIMKRRALAPPLSPTGVIDPKYQCHVLENLEDYAANYTVPWSESCFFRGECAGC